MKKLLNLLSIVALSANSTHVALACSPKATNTEPNQDLVNLIADLNQEVASVFFNHFKEIEDNKGLNGVLMMRRCL
ncbi:hypothetical protein SCLARK_00628 [Spiroplasma clarkii]|uniref:hypothetical protein n=1 Tax=Spiroplasma clarkii TaxID=2139 RepID=UPI000B553DBA|nr:hypothetical protein [Spiroplasma clarkii]ARU91295.1 hypothetical protein SCLARK_00628 [Spiroplasma clarkii]